MHWAVALGQVGIVEMLMTQGNTCLLVMARFIVMNRCIKRKSRICATNAAGETFRVRNIKGDTPLHRACMWHFCWETKTLPRLLEMCSQNLGSTNGLGQTCLHVVCDLLQVSVSSAWSSGWGGLKYDMHATH